MPVRLGVDKEGCFARWGNKGKRYYYPCGNENKRNEAKQKAYEQGLATGEYNKEILKYANTKISYDYDGTLTNNIIKEQAKSDVEMGKIVYIISARDNKESMLKIADEIGILHSRIFATGSNQNKINKIKELGINKHYDNNSDVINELGNIGKLV